MCKMAILKKTKNWFSRPIMIYRLMQVKSIAECSHSNGSILQYLLPSLSYHLSRSLCCMTIFEWPFNTCFTVFLSLKVVLILANSVDPDEMQHYTAFHRWVFTVYQNTHLGVTSIDESKHYVTNQYHLELYGLYPIAGKFSGWQ